MQRRPSGRQSISDDSGPELKFPVISVDDNVEVGPDRSFLLAIPEVEAPSVSAMALHSDDSSVDGSMSSWSDNTWPEEMIEEDNAAFGGEAGGISRQSTPFTDQPVLLHADQGSLAGNESSGESQANRSVHRLVDFSHSRKDSSSDPPDTARQLAPNESTLYGIPPTLNMQNSERTQPIRFYEGDHAEEQATTEQDVNFCLLEFEGRRRKEIINEHQLGETAEISGTVRQRMSKTPLNLRSPFTVLYTGAPQMRAPIVEKIAAALAANFSSASRETVDSSRVTIVPISAFTEHSSPDVLLIDSIGLDMKIEECTAALRDKGEESKGTITLELNHHRLVESSWDATAGRYEVPKDYRLPDLAVVYLPETESSTAKKTRLQARAFLTRHNVPTIVVSFDSEWKKPIPAIFIDPRSPHLCIESFDHTRDEGQVLKRLPIDLNTFLNIDAGQMNRNLACLTSTSTRDESYEDGDFADASIRSSSNKARTAMPPTPRIKSSVDRSNSLTKRVPAVVSLLIGLGLLFLAIGSSTDLLSENPSWRLLTRHFSKHTHSQLPSTPSERHAPFPAAARTQTTSTSLTDWHTNTDLASLLIQSSFAPNKSDKFQVHVIGDNHVILRPPTWFRMLKKAPALFFKVQRRQKQLEYEFSTLFEGVHALKLRTEDAHGKLDITVWSIRKPKVNETFQVDFGTPWLKVVGWQKAAQAMTEQVRDELHSARTGLSRAYGSANDRIQMFFKDSVERLDSVLKEVERAGLDSLQHTTKTTGSILESSRELSRTLTQRLQQHGEIASTSLIRQREKLRRDVLAYSRRMSALLSEQGGILADAAAGLGRSTLAQEIQLYRETHFRETQKRMLYAWWRVAGPPTSVSPQSNLNPVCTGKLCRGGKATKAAKVRAKRKSEA